MTCEIAQAPGNVMCCCTEALGRYAGFLHGCVHYGCVRPLFLGGMGRSELKRRGVKQAPDWAQVGEEFRLGHCVIRPKEIDLLSQCESRLSLRSTLGYLKVSQMFIYIYTRALDFRTFDIHLTCFDISLLAIVGCMERHDKPNQHTIRIIGL